MKTIEHSVDDSVSIDAMFSEGDRFRAQGRTREAINCYEKVLVLAPKSHLAFHKIGEALVREDNLPEAISAYRKAIVIKPSFKWSHHCLGLALMWAKDYAASALAFRQAIRLDPQFAPFQSYLGKALLESGELDAAVAVLEQALTLDSQLYSTHIHLGELYSATGDYTKAIAHYQSATELESNNFWAHCALARLYARIDSYERAITQYKRAIDLNPNFANTHLEIGEVYQKRGDLAAATESYLSAIAIDPNYETAYSALQYAAVESESLDTLVAAYREIVRKHPNAYLAWGNLGDALMQQRKTAEAVQAYQKGCYQHTILERPDLKARTWKAQKELGPDYIIIGAGKCGTSSLHKYIGAHPNVLLPHKKELNFFNSHLTWGKEWYLAQFPSITDSPDFVTGESSPGYFHSHSVDTRIHNFFPTTKFILLLRNPVDRAVSWHYHNVKRGWENRRLETVMDAEIARLSQLSEADYATAGGHLAEGLYFYKLRRWMSLFEKEQFLVLESETFYSQTSTVMKEVFDFLELAPYEAQNYPKYNIGSYSKISPSLRQKLEDVFRPHNQKLSEYLNKDFSWCA